MNTINDLNQIIEYAIGNFRELTPREYYQMFYRLLRLRDARERQGLSLPPSIFEAAMCLKYSRIHSAAIRSFCARNEKISGWVGQRSKIQYDLRLKLKAEIAVMRWIISQGNGMGHLLYWQDPRLGVSSYEEYKQKYGRL